MARTKTLLDGVNDTLIRVGQIDSQSKLVNLANPALQRFIDSCVNLWNDSIQDLYTLTEIPMPVEVKEADPPITLVEGQDEYDLPSDLIQIRWPLEDRVTGLRIHEYPGGFEQMRQHRRIPSMWKGLPIRACISPINRKLKMERFPEAGHAGRVYQLTYDRTVLLDNASDLMPFEDDVFLAMTPLVASLWELAQAGETTQLGRIGYGRASRLLSGSQMKSVY